MRLLLAPLLTPMVLLAASAAAQMPSPTPAASAAPPAAASASADATADAPRIEYPSVAAALKALEARDGNGTVVTHVDGWTIINEPLAAAQWSFAPSGYYAYPAVVRRIIKRSADGNVAVQTTQLCEAAPADCSKMLAEFAEMNDRISQAVKSRGRQRPTMPPQ